MRKLIQNVEDIKIITGKIIAGYDKQIQLGSYRRRYDKIERFCYLVTPPSALKLLLVLVLLLAFLSSSSRFPLSSVNISQSICN